MAEIRLILTLLGLISFKMSYRASLSTCFIGSSGFTFLCFLLFCGFPILPIITQFTNTFDVNSTDSCKIATIKIKTQQRGQTLPYFPTMRSGDFRYRSRRSTAIRCPRAYLHGRRPCVQIICKFSPFQYYVMRYIANRSISFIFYVV